jgi:hypothetical protein
MITLVTAVAAAFALIVNCHNPWGVPGDRLIIGDQVYVCTTIGVWAPL